MNVNVVCAFIAMTPKAWLIGMPIRKQKHPGKSDAFTQLNVALQQKVRFVIYSALGVHGKTSLTWIFCDKVSQTIKCGVYTEVICGYTLTIKHTKNKLIVLGSENFQH